MKCSKDKKQCIYVWERAKCTDATFWEEWESNPAHLPMMLMATGLRGQYSFGQRANQKLCTLKTMGVY